MFIRPIFESLGITIVTLGILLMTLAYSPLALIAGIGVLVAGLLLIYRHYVELGSNTGMFD